MEERMIKTLCKKLASKCYDRIYDYCEKVYGDVDSNEADGSSITKTIMVQVEDVWYRCLCNIGWSINVHHSPQTYTDPEEWVIERVADTSVSRVVNENTKEIVYDSAKKIHYELCPMMRSISCRDII